MTDENKYFELEKQFLNFPDFDCADGWILDFGGGGEGIIGQVKGTRVVAIDLRKSELEEALERDCDALLIEMDGTDLKFLDSTFNTATAFFSLMYVREEKDFYKIFSEIFRVLKNGGKFLIWDVNFSIPKEFDHKIVVFYLDIKLPSDKLVKTGYGTRKKHQNLNMFKEVAEKIGFKVEQSNDSDVQFFLELKKE